MGSGGGVGLTAGLLLCERDLVFEAARAPCLQLGKGTAEALGKEGVCVWLPAVLRK